MIQDVELTAFEALLVQYPELHEIYTALAQALFGWLP